MGVALIRLQRSTISYKPLLYRAPPHDSLTGLQSFFLTSTCYAAFLLCFVSAGLVKSLPRLPSRTFLRLSPSRMDATRSFSSSKMKKGPMPAFYHPPSSSTSAKIIEEARRSLRVLPTERPSTPADANRTLFGSRKPYSRPPSVYRCVRTV